MSVRLTLKSVTSSEVELGLDLWFPENNAELFLCLDLEISFNDDEIGSNMFYVTLATPESLRKFRPINYALVKNHTLVVNNYNYQNLIEVLNSILVECTSTTYEESCILLQRYFKWEYDSFKSV